MGEPWAGAVETHTAALFFAGDRVYKVKKPVRLDFVDLTNREARRQACEAEVALNSRLAADVYLGVASIDLDGHLPEHAVVMRRLPGAASLVERVRHRDRDLCRYVAEVADVLAAFHATCPVVGRDLPNEMWSPPAELWRTEVSRIARLRSASVQPDLLQRSLRLAETYAGGRRDLFAQRLADGFVRDGHGDLLASDIYLLPDGPRVLDCLEFDDRLRVCDVLHDVAFLATDLERLGRSDLAEVLLHRYRCASGEVHPASLAHFFIAHRALIRAKVHAIRAGQCDETDPAVGHLLRMCLAHLEQAEVRLVLVGGLPAAGKTTLSTALAEGLPGQRLSSDEIRYRLARDLSADGGFDQGRYSPAVSRRVYAELLDRARAHLERGEHVILDASWRSADERSRARRLAADVGAVAVEIRAESDDAVANGRLAQRTVVPGGSEAGVDTRCEMRRHFDPWPQATAVSTDTGVERSLAGTVSAVNAAARGAQR